MGEEYGEENPFPFFCSFRGEELASAVRDGRRREFHAYDPAGEVADPNAEATFDSARLSWSWPEGTARAGLRRLYRDLLAARREWPALRDYREPIGPPDFGRRRQYSSRAGTRGASPTGVVARLFSIWSDRPSRFPADIPAGMTLRFSSESEAYGGSRERIRRIERDFPLRVCRVRAVFLEIVPVMQLTTAPCVRSISIADCHCSSR